MKIKRQVEQEISICDICGSENAFLNFCQKCGKEACSKCSASYEFNVIRLKNELYFVGKREGLYYRCCEGCSKELEAGLIKLGFQPFSHELRGV